MKEDHPVMNELELTDVKMRTKAINASLQANPCLSQLAPEPFSPHLKEIRKCMLPARLDARLCPDHGQGKIFLHC